MIARVEHRKLLALAALTVVMCVLLLLGALFVRVQQVDTTLSGFDAKVTSTSERGHDGAKGGTLTRDPLIERHAEVVARYHQDSLR